MSNPKKSATEVTAPAVSLDLDGLSFEQALIDFEVANARVLDLTSRLTTEHADLIRLRNEVEELRLQLHVQHAAHVEAARQLAELRSSRAYQAARTLGLARARLRR